MSVFFYALLPMFSSVFSRVSRVRWLEITFFLIAAATLFLILGFRGEAVGTDTANYYKMFYAINRAPGLSETPYEPGFSVLNRIVGSQGLGPEFVVLVSSFFVILAISYFCFKFSPAVGLSLILYAGLFGYFFAFNGMRQALSQAAVLVAYTLYFSRQKVLASIAYCLAPMVHSSAIVFVPFLALLLIPHNILRLILPIAWLLSLPFLATAAPFQQVKNLFIFFVPDGYSVYLEGGLSSGDVSLRDVYLQMIFVFLYASFVFTKLRHHSAIIILSLLGIIFSNILNHSGQPQRIALFWEPFIIAALPVAIFKYRSFDRSLLYWIFASTAVVFYVRAVIIGSNKATPYESWLFPFL